MINEALRTQKKVKTSQTKGFCQIRNKALALTNPYIQANPLNSIEWIIIDCDYELPYFKDMAVVPNYIVRNKHNGKGHLYYKISAVHNNGFSSYKAIEYCNAVRYGLTILLNGDLAFTQTLSKNPLAVDHWRVEHLHSEEYELSELAEYCELVPKYKLKELKHKERAEIIGRNPAIFWTAKDIAKGLTDLNSIFDICSNLNDFSEPLGYKEVLGIAKSIHRHNLKPQTKATKEWLEERAKKNNKKSQAVRKEKAQVKKDKAFVLFANSNLKLKDIADKLELSLISIKKYKAEYKKVYFTNQVVPPTIPTGASSQSSEMLKVDLYLADTFSLHAEREDTEKIPIKTVNRLLE
jgi:hypothetical protein